VTLELLTGLMAKAQGRCAYAEARHVDLRQEALSVRAGEVDEFAASSASGIGVRVRVGGGWGFAATRDVSAPSAEAALRRQRADRDEHADQEVGDAHAEQRLQRITELHAALVQQYAVHTPRQHRACHENKPRHRSPHCLTASA